MDDLIRRSDAIEAIHSYWKGELSKMPTTDSEYGEVIDGDCDTLLKHNKELSTRIKDIPSADRPSGEWIDRGMRVPCSWVKKCSLCGHETDTWRWCKFCPNCGARMKGADDEGHN